jgi:hypothetical protein
MPETRGRTAIDTTENSAHPDQVTSEVRGNSATRLSASLAPKAWIRDNPLLRVGRRSSYGCSEHALHTNGVLPADTFGSHVPESRLLERAHGREVIGLDVRHRR